MIRIAVLMIGLLTVGACGVEGDPEPPVSSLETAPIMVASLERGVAL